MKCKTNLPESYLQHKHLIWWMESPNWKDEMRTRLKKQCYDPFINPKTLLPYSQNALNYRDNFYCVLRDSICFDHRDA